MRERLDVVVERSPMRRLIDFWLVQGLGTGEHYFAQPVVMESKDDVGVSELPTFSLSYDDAQKLIDELWRCGLRPTEGTGSAGALAATQKHLDDMREIAFAYLYGGAGNARETD